MRSRVGLAHVWGVVVALCLGVSFRMHASGGGQEDYNKSHTGFSRVLS